MTACRKKVTRPIENNVVAYIFDWNKHGYNAKGEMEDHNIQWRPTQTSSNSSLDPVPSPR